MQIDQILLNCFNGFRNPKKILITFILYSLTKITYSIFFLNLINPENNLGCFCKENALEVAANQKVQF